MPRAVRDLSGGQFGLLIFVLPHVPRPACRLCRRVVVAVFVFRKCVCRHILFIISSLYVPEPTSTLWWQHLWWAPRYASSRCARRRTAFVLLPACYHVVRVCPPFSPSLGLGRLRVHPTVVPLVCGCVWWPRLQLVVPIAPFSRSSFRSQLVVFCAVSPTCRFDHRLRPFPLAYCVLLAFVCCVSLSMPQAARSCSFLRSPSAPPSSLPRICVPSVPPLVLICLLRALLSPRCASFFV